ncbi:MAG: hypothetical protein Q7S88_03745 [Candidatus Daviesbacteria bacterium]|nr:hypothetical protein [Candidatus Daviesbacteria bacterium]
MAERSEMDIEIAALRVILVAASKRLDVLPEISRPFGSTPHLLYFADQSRLDGAIGILDLLTRKQPRWDFVTGGGVELPKVSDWEEGDI